MEKVTKMMLVAIAVFSLFGVATAQSQQWATDVTGTALGAPAIADAAGVGKTANGIAVASAANGGWVFICGTADMTATAGNAAAVTMAGFVASFDPGSGALVSKMVFSDAAAAATALGAGTANGAAANVVTLNAIAVDNTRDIVYAVGATDNNGDAADSSVDLIVAFGFTPTTGALTMTIGGSTNTTPIHAVWNNNSASLMSAAGTGIVNIAAGTTLPTDASGFGSACELLGVAVNQTTGTIYCVGAESNNGAAEHTFGVAAGASTTPATTSFKGSVFALTFSPLGATGANTANGRGRFSIPAGSSELTAAGTGAIGATGFDTVFHGVTVASDGTVYVAGTQGSAAAFQASVAKIAANLGGVTWTYVHGATQNGGVVNLNSAFYSIAISGTTVVAAGTRVAGASTTLDNDSDFTRNGLLCSLNSTTGTLNWYAEYDDNDSGNGKTNGSTNANNAAVQSLGLTGQAIEFRGVTTDGSFVYVTGTAMMANADTAGPWYTAGLTRMFQALAANGSTSGNKAGGAKARDPRLFDDVVAGELNATGVTQVIVAKINVVDGNLIWVNKYNETSVGTGAGQAIALDTKSETVDVAGFRATVAASTILDASVLNVTKGATASAGGSSFGTSTSGGSGGCGAVGLDALALLGVAYLLRRKANKS